MEWSEIYNLAKTTVEKVGNVDDVDQVPLAIDLTAFVIWLREQTDFFSGPDLNITYPRGTSPEFIDVLAKNALLYTGE